jgi:hypothetical protein
MLHLALVYQPIDLWLAFYVKIDYVNFLIEEFTGVARVSQPREKL